MIWSVEAIPDDDELYMRVHRGDFAEGRADPGAFRDRGGAGISTDWAKYAAPQDTRARARQPASEYAVVALRAGTVRSETRLRVQHSPILPDPNGATELDRRGNRAHADIFGLRNFSKVDQTDIRLTLSRVACVRIHLDDPVGE